MALTAVTPGTAAMAWRDAVEVLKTRVVVRRAAERQGERQEVARVEAGVDVLEPQERASHQTGSGQQRECKRELEAEQPAPHSTPPHAFGRSAGSVLQRLLHIRA